MPIVAICPYCKSGGVRAPDRAAGASVSCPKCKSSFTVIPSNDLPGWANDGPADIVAKPSVPKPPPAEPQAKPREETKPHASAPDETEPSPVLPGENAEKPRPAPAPTAAAAPAAAPDEPTEGSDTAFVVALVGATLFGLAVVATLFPFGRFVCVGLAGLGAVAGLTCLGAEGRARLVGVGAMILNVGAVLLALLAPSWLGIDTGGSDLPEAPKTPVAVGLDGEGSAPAEWIDPSKANWVFGDLRVAVRTAYVAPVEVIGPKDAKKLTKEPYLQISVRVANAGVERKVELSGWAAAPGADGPVLTDPEGKPLKVKRFEGGWEPVAAAKPGALFPGKSVDLVLLFEPPAKPATLKLELPGAAIGSAHPVKFVIPESFLAARRGPVAGPGGGP